MLPAELLAELQRLLRQNGHRKQASYLAPLVEQHPSDPIALARALATNEIWGGSGSIADQCFVPDEQQSGARALARQRFYQLMSELARSMELLGVTHPRAAAWAGAFDQWRASE